MNNQILLSSISIKEFRSFIDESVQKAISSIHTPRHPDQDDLIKIEDVCKILNISRVTVHYWKKSGKLPFYKISNKVYFKKNEVLEALKKIERRSF